MMLLPQPPAAAGAWQAAATILASAVRRNSATFWTYSSTCTRVGSAMNWESFAEREHTCCHNCSLQGGRRRTVPAPTDAVAQKSAADVVML